MSEGPVEFFDLAESPLEGTNLIEAGAGTGKTYAIAGLYLRLVLEQGLGVEQVLVVTFTVAATEELKTRVRERLLDALAVLGGSESPRPGDELMSGVARRYRGDAGARRRLRDALRDFDVAAIYTIHGFCQRMLMENAFESASPFDAELVADSLELTGEIVDDFWRRAFYRAPGSLVGYALSRKMGPDYFAGLLGKRSLDPSFTLVPAAEILPRDEVVRGLAPAEETYGGMQAAWESSRDAVRSLLLNDRGLKKNIYPPASVPRWIDSMDDFLIAGNIMAESKALEKFARSALAGGVKKGFSPPEHPFFDLCETLLRRREAARPVLDRYLLGLKADFFRFFSRELPRRKERSGERSFDDLLEDMYRSLKEGPGSRLAEAVRRRYAAALIDEFQDTDPLQYRIFTTIFGGEGSILFLIGDPKQAIYGFRGADIFAYMKASREVKRRYTLARNWRSSAGLIGAVNSLLAGAPAPFVFGEIGFTPAEPGGGEEQEKCLTVDGARESPMEIWSLDEGHGRGREGAPVPKGRAERLMAQGTAAEIARLVNLGKEGRALIGVPASAGGSLKPRHIAVLVRTHEQARMVRGLLRDFSVPCVFYGAESVFASREAADMLRLMAGIAEPSREARLKAALGTDILGLNGNDIHSLSEDERGWETWLERFGDYHARWSRQGFIMMFHRLIRREGVKERLLSFDDGERRMTNLLHCAELLHGAEKERALGMEGLIAWLSERRRSAPKSDEYQLRLETDEDAVTIITIHRSKGLQFPVVFCPFLWEGVREGRAADFVFHDPGNRYVPTLDIGSGDAGHRALLLREELAENMRLFYVALTRARYRCCWTWGFINTAETSAPAYTLFRPEAGDAAVLMDELKSAFIASGHEGIRGLLLALERKSKGNIRVRGFPGMTAERYTPYDAAPGALESRRFTGAVRKDWKVASFTSLAAASFAGTEDPDRDEAGSLPPPAARRPDGEDISLFPAGAAAGNCIHEMLQKLDFERLEDPGSEKLIRDALDRHGFERRWTPVIKEMLRKTLSAPLDPGDPGLVLEKVACADRLTEMEFYFPLKRIRMPGLADVFASRLDAPWRDEFCARLRGLPAESVRGMARGFIDLVFRHAGRYYIVDWKSNLLGGSPGDYTEGALRSAMMTHLYFLQYHLYAVAVHRYLRLRHPGYRHGDHFGGVYYLFLRGVNPGRSPETGIYRDLPGEGLLEELSRYLSNGEEG